MLSTIIGSMEYIIPFLVVLTILVFVHELGHFLVARYNGVKVEVFSIGFGPELFGWNDKKNTRWKFSLIPLGGYVKMFGDADASSRPDTDAVKAMDDAEKSLSLHGKTVGQRMAVSAAGPLANFIFAIVVLSGLYVVKGEPILPTTIGAVVEGKLADKAGLKAGDKIVSLNGATAADFYELRDLIVANKGKDVDIRFTRSGAEKSTFIKMVEADTSGNVKPVGQLGIAPGAPEYHRISLLKAVPQSVYTTYKLCADTLFHIKKMITREVSSDGMGGILSIGDMAGKSAESGIAALLFFACMLSINLGFINLLPVPVLDGGHLLFYGIEAIIGRPVPEKIQEYAFMAGLLVVVGTMLLTTWNDVIRLFWH